jgi:hypothetical protein
MYTYVQQRRQPPVTSLYVHNREVNGLTEISARERIALLCVGTFASLLNYTEYFYI